MLDRTGCCGAAVVAGHISAYNLFRRRVHDEGAWLEPEWAADLESDLAAAELPERELLVEFLCEVVLQDFGIPRWEALELLCGLTDRGGAEALERVIAGLRRMDCRHEDLRIIEKRKGAEFLAGHGLGLTR